MKNLGKFMRLKKNYYISVLENEEQKTFRIVIYNQNGKFMYCCNGLYSDLLDCINMARKMAFEVNIKFVMPVRE